MSTIHPTIAAALAHWTPPTLSPCPTEDVCRKVGCHGACDRRTPEQEDRWVAADVARVREESRPDAEERRADRIERRDRDTRSLMFAALVPGDRS